MKEILNKNKLANREWQLQYNLCHIVWIFPLNRVVRHPLYGPNLNANCFLPAEIIALQQFYLCLNTMQFQLMTFMGCAVSFTAHVEGAFKEWYTVQVLLIL